MEEEKSQGTTLTTRVYMYVMPQKQQLKFYFILYHIILYYFILQYQHMDLENKFRKNLTEKFI